MKVIRDNEMMAIYAKGNFFEVGVQVGEATRELVHFMSAQVSADLLNNVFGGEIQAMVVVAKSQHDKAYNYFPEAGQYLEGLAFGANIHLDDLLSVAYSEEMSALVSETVGGKLARARDRCSTLVTRGLHGWLMGHQEDFWGVFFGKMLVLELQFKGYPKLVSLSYPGQLPALAGSLNAAGVAITNNSLWPKAGRGISKQTRHFRAALATNFLNAAGVAITNNSLWPKAGRGISKQTRHFRAALATNFLDALTTLARGPHALTDHFILISAREDLAASIEVSNPVASPDECVIRQIVHNEPAILGESVAAPFAHANHAQLLELHETDPAHLGSYMRLGKLYAEASRHCPRSAADMLELLTRPDGILRKLPDKNLTGQENSVTLATTVISPSEGKIIFVRYGAEDLARNDFIL